MAGGGGMMKTAKKGFTMVELMVVMAMLMLLIGAVSSSVASASRRAKISKATTTVQEMTNAILAYENAGHPLSSHSMQQWTVADESSMGFILGTESEDVPVLFNAAIRNGKILDPWGKPYYVMIRKGNIKQELKERKVENPTSFFPNLNRITAD